MKVYYEKSLGIYSWWTPFIVPTNYKEVLSFITVLNFNFWVICWTGCESICPLPEMTILVARFADMPSQVHWTQISFSILFLACIYMSLSLRHKHIWPGWIRIAMKTRPYSEYVNSFWKQSTSYDKQLLFKSCGLWNFMTPIRQNKKMKCEKKNECRIYSFLVWLWWRARVKCIRAIWIGVQKEVVL
jgi:hypothetical protein